MLNLISRWALSLFLFGAFSFNAIAAQLSVGNEAFTEQRLLAELTKQYLNSQGHEITSKGDMFDKNLRRSIVSGRVDIAWFYTGSALRDFNQIETAMTPVQAYELVKKLDKSHGILWLDMSETNNSYGIAVRREDAEKYGINNMSELDRLMLENSHWKLATDSSFYSRKDGLKPLMKHYAHKMSHGNLKIMKPDETYDALKSGRVDIAMVYATDGRIKAYDLVVLEDDKHFFPGYILAPVVSATLPAEEQAQVTALLNNLSGVLTTESMIEMNGRVDLEQKSVREVASHFLKANKLL
ncbi:glycine/betaine ABC transporter substrate-binding protein [Endozoicomonas sp. OPT23]|uniref:ABC transporter substrate-binding protein n=1 Tax=Endozoicomonas sp. OPT23 TaxID=2072845 RepID=UPI00129A520D|nr:glycine betaine ABC transporter substrate-binding protein [Endozoicomonas sp. OPT23]MRI34619.1 glycine/betaine ABC transporter substrate-binding protein [Endozoicomonas sp. OPT23]